MGEQRRSRNRSPARNVLSARNDHKVQKRRKTAPRPQDTDRVTITHLAAAPGYIYVPIGTPDLAQRCRELSQEHGYSWKFVNAWPSSEIVTDPGKISFHMQRIGYHFKTELLEQACQELDYQLCGKEYITRKELQEREQNEVIARAMERIGCEVPAPTESIEKVSAVIKELYPCIPDSDRLRVIEHSFNKDSDRVGANTEESLARRVQLSVVASIRHSYTDYDVLIKTFSWQDARDEVEPVSLKKVIEWRGELKPGQTYHVESAGDSHDEGRSDHKRSKAARPKYNWRKHLRRRDSTDYHSETDHPADQARDSGSRPAELEEQTSAAPEHWGYHEPGYPPGQYLETGPQYGVAQSIEPVDWAARYSQDHGPQYYGEQQRYALPAQPSWPQPPGHPQYQGDAYGVYRRY